MAGGSINLHTKLFLIVGLGVGKIGRFLTSSVQDQAMKMSSRSLILEPDIGRGRESQTMRMRGEVHGCYLGIGRMKPRTHHI